MPDSPGTPAPRIEPGSPVVTPGVDAMSLASVWWSMVATTSYVPMSSDRARMVLAGMVSQLVEVLDGDPFSPEAAGNVGAALVGMNLTDPVVLVGSFKVLSRLPELADSRETDAGRARLTALLGAFAHGYTAALQTRTRAGQESIQQAMAAARQNATVALHACDARFRVIFENAAVAIAFGDTAGRLTDVNTALADMLGRPVAALRGASLIECLHPTHRDEWRARIAELVAARGGTLRVETRFRRGDGSHGWMLLAVTLIPGVEESGDQLLGVGEDITQRRRLQAELSRQARHDPLTGLPNRLLLLETVQTAIATAAPGQRIGLCVLDLDGFKEVNDRYGHGTGDRLLAAVATRLREAAASNGHLVGRIGGDEFLALISPPTQDRCVAAAAESLRAALIDPFCVDGHRMLVSISIGAVVTEARGASAEGLIDAADRWLYRAKADGRDRVVLRATAPVAEVLTVGGRGVHRAEGRDRRAAAGLGT